MVDGVRHRHPFVRPPVLRTAADLRSDFTPVTNRAVLNFAAGGLGMAKARVLLVEDDLSLRETLAAALELDGWEVEALANGRDALQALSVRRPDVIVLDLMMPVMDGWEFRRLQREHHGEIPVVVVSAAGEVHLAE